VKKRPEEITRDFNNILDDHLEKIIQGEVDTFLEIQEVAKLMHIHPTHLSNTLKETTGKSPCDICNEKTINLAKRLLKNPAQTIANIASKLTFEPTNFTKYFKKHTGQTPSEYRKRSIMHLS
jgi:AraC family transcriptional regulator of adaptative response / methylphosphotriester-DNA alkyltransferase methyltransferase